MNNLKVPSFPRPLSLPDRLDQYENHYQKAPEVSINSDPENPSPLYSDNEFEEITLDVPNRSESLNEPKKTFFLFSCCSIDLKKTIIRISHLFFAIIPGFVISSLSFIIYQIQKFKHLTDTLPKCFQGFPDVDCSIHIPSPPASWSSPEVVGTYLNTIIDDISLQASQCLSASSQSIALWKDEVLLCSKEATSNSFVSNFQTWLAIGTVTSFSLYTAYQIAKKRLALEKNDLN